jgi:hypothetical protein
MLLKIKKIGCKFSKPVPGGVSWPLGPTGIIIFGLREIKVGPP